MLCGNYFVAGCYEVSTQVIITLAWICLLYTSRYELMGWAASNDSYIIEDDYDSELRYFSKPIPALKSLENSSRVIYLGSFSSTLFAAVKISYMVLPEEMARLFSSMAQDYSQTCSRCV